MCSSDLEEEVHHVKEEMRRYIESARFHSEQWLSRSNHRTSVSSELADGLRSYAHRQAYIRMQQAIINSQLWGMSSDELAWATDGITKFTVALNELISSPECGEVQETDNDTDDEALGMRGDVIDASDLSDTE